MVLPTMIALKELYHDKHWKARNYEDHLMYQRLYESIDKDIDPTGEILKGTIGLDMTASQRVHKAAEVIDRLGADVMEMENSFQKICERFKGRSFGHHFEELIVHSIQRQYLLGLSL
jgi:DNA-binding ferritin-like protein